MRSDVASWTAGRVLVAMGVAGFIVAFGYMTYQFIFNAPKGSDPRDYKFYYGHTCFTRSASDRIFTKVNLRRDGNGPWLWISETEGFQVDRENSLGISKRIAQQIGIREPQPHDHVVYVADGGWALRLVTADNRDERESDGWIDAGRDAIPISISMTEDGPRISFPCTEKELRKAFGEPIIQRSDLPNTPQGAPGV